MLYIYLLAAVKILMPFNGSILDKVISEYTQNNSVVENIVHVFEITRHGARTPEFDAKGFSVPVLQLTNQGIRQRYLLGRHNWKKYGSMYEHNDKNDQLPLMKGLKMKSSVVYRTIQSGYAELMGFA